MSRMLLSVVLALFVAPTGMARTWTVSASGGGDFRDIQSAVNAATDGDVILVSPTGAYAGFSCSKGVTIRSTTGRFLLEDYAVIQISKVFFWKTFALVGVDAQEYPLFQISNCNGDVLLENIVANEFSYIPNYTAIVEIDTCRGVSINDCMFVTTSNNGQGVPGNINITASSVRMNDVLSVGGVGGGIGQTRGDPGCCVYNSYVEIASSTLIGGKGQDYYNGRAAKGGEGLYVNSSLVRILGSPTDAIIGGDGGDANPYFQDCGNGADGVVMVQSTVEISQVQLMGGQPGAFGSCSPGAPFSGGTPLRMDVLPALSATSEFRYGRSAELLVQGTEPGQVFVMSSSTLGFVEIPQTLGFKLSVARGPAFLFFGIGRTDGSGLARRPFTVPPDPILVGEPLHMQSLFVGVSGTSTLSNCVTRVVGQ